MSTSAIPVHVALVDDTHTIDMQTLAEVAGALNEQVQADFAPVWHVKATVGAYQRVTAGTWALRLRRRLDEPGALGYHTDDHHQPYALIDATAGDWSVTASHELLEMLADPWGNRLHGAVSPDGWKGPGARVRYLVEVGDPCESTTYEVGGVSMSDFILPAFYRSSRRAGVAYSHTGSIDRPRHVNPGGYISFVDETGSWWQRFVDDNGQVTDQELGQPGQSASLREWTDRCANEHRGRV